MFGEVGVEQHARSLLEKYARRQAVIPDGKVLLRVDPQQCHLDALANLRRLIVVQQVDDRGALQHRHGRFNSGHGLDFGEDGLLECSAAIGHDLQRCPAGHGAVHVVVGFGAVAPEAVVMETTAATPSTTLSSVKMALPGRLPTSRMVKVQRVMRRSLAARQSTIRRIYSPSSRPFNARPAPGQSPPGCPARRTPRRADP